MLSKLRKYKGLKLAHLNIRSLLPKIDQLRLIMSDKSIDILSLNETFLSDEVSDSGVSIPGYMLYRRDRGSRHGGGVALYVNNNLPSTVMTNTYTMATDVECLWINIDRHHTKGLIVGSMYRPPSSNQQYYESMGDILDKVTTDNDCDTIVMGDINYNYSLDENLANNHINYIEQLTGLTQIVMEPTRVTMTTSSLIDVILTTNTSKHIKTGVIPLTLSDHYMTFTVISGKPTKSTESRTITVRDYKKCNRDVFKQDLYKTMPNINTIITNSQLSVDEAWSLWRKTFDEICQVHAPMKIIRVRNRHNPWMSPEILSLMYKT